MFDNLPNTFKTFHDSVFFNFIHSKKSFLYYKS